MMKNWIKAHEVRRDEEKKRAANAFTNLQTVIADKHNLLHTTFNKRSCFPLSAFINKFVFSLSLSLRVCLHFNFTMHYEKKKLGWFSLWYTMIFFYVSERASMKWEVCIISGRIFWYAWAALASTVLFMCLQHSHQRRQCTNVQATLYANLIFVMQMHPFRFALSKNMYIVFHRSSFPPKKMESCMRGATTTRAPAPAMHEIQKW